MDEKKKEQPNSPFEITDKLKQTKNVAPQSPVAPKSVPKDLPTKNQENKSADTKPKEPFLKKLRTGSKQFSAIPTSQKFTPPPETAPVANTPLPTQPLANTSENLPQKPKPFFTPIKLSVLIFLLILIGFIAISATLVATDYTIFNPPEPIKNVLEFIFSGYIN